MKAKDIFICPFLFIVNFCGCFMKTELLTNLLKMTGILIFSFLPIALIANYKMMVDPSSFNIGLYRYFGASWFLAFLLCFVIIVIMFKVKERSRKK